ncbi:MAG: hypothetical protein J7L47_04680 [Candidatus Odinarchaeota archaeon]|nr:hypothetical protein [Candidatus Odinarchaeota archaeon]
MDISLFLLIITAEVVGSTIAFVITLQRFIKSKCYPELFLSLLFGDLLIWGLLTIIGGVAQAPQLANLLLKASILVGISGFIPLFLFFDSIFRRKYDILVLVALFFTLGGFFVSVVIYDGVTAFLAPDSNFYVLVFLSIHVRVLFILTAGITGVYCLLITLKYIISPLRKQKYVAKRVKHQVYLFLLSEIIAVIGSAVSSYLVRFLSFEYRILPFFIITAIGTMLILVGYILSPKTPFVIAATPISLFVITETGIELFSFNFVGEEYINNALIGPVLSALLQFSKKTLHADKELTEVRWGSLMLIVKPKGYLRFALLSEKYHSILETALSNFADIFYKTYAPFLKDLKHLKNVSPFKKSDYLVEQAFPFLSLQKSKKKVKFS